MREYKAVVKDIAEHIIYYKDFWVEEYLFFLDKETNENHLQTLSDKVMEENPNIELTDPDYNYFLFLDDWFENGGRHIRFCDRVTGFGQDTDDYRFCTMQGIEAVSVLHEGPFELLSEAHSFAAEWIKENSYTVCGSPRDSFIHGFWDRQDPQEYLTEVQIPVRKSV